MSTIRFAAGLTVETAAVIAFIYLAMFLLFA